MARKVFISVLGFSNYGKCYYTCDSDGFKSGEVRYVQEAILGYLMSLSKWSDKDCGYILLTEGAEKRNWLDNGQVDRDNNPIEQKGLASVLEEMRLPFKVLPVRHIPDGNNEKEIWSIFSQVFDLLQDGDELFFDLTHGFRYLPMLILVLGNYSKLLKNVSVRSITYGNYEARNRETNEAPMIDLLPLSDLQDWTTASSAFLRNGNLAMLKSQCTQSLAPILREAKGTNSDATALKKYMTALEKVVDDMNTCRGLSVITGEHVAELDVCANELSDVIIEPMKPIVERLKRSFTNFIPSKNIKNGFYAAKWCFDNSLYQQSLTILHETIVSFICEDEALSIKEAAEREIVNKSFHIYLNNTEKDKWLCDESYVPLIERVLNNKNLALLASTFQVTTNLRNDYNHAGMRANPMKRMGLISNLRERLDILISLIEQDKLCL